MDSTNTKFANRILDLLDQNNGSMLYVDILNSIKDEKPIHTDAMLKVMIKEGLVSGRTGAYERIRITPKGTAQLIAYREQLAVETANVESSEQSPTNANNTDETADNNQSKKLRLPKAVKLIFEIVAVIGTIVATIVGVYEVYTIFFA